LDEQYIVFCLHYKKKYRIACYNKPSPKSTWRIPQTIEITRAGPSSTPKSYRLLSNLGELGVNERRQIRKAAGLERATREDPPEDFKHDYPCRKRQTSGPFHSFTISKNCCGFLTLG